MIQQTEKINRSQIVDQIIEKLRIKELVTARLTTIGNDIFSTPSNQKAKAAFEFYAVDIVKDWIAEYFNVLYLADTFNDKELQELSAIVDTPLYQKWISVNSDIGDTCTAALTKRLRGLSEITHEDLYRRVVYMTASIMYNTNNPEMTTANIVAMVSTLLGPASAIMPPKTEKLFTTTMVDLAKFLDDLSSLHSTPDAVLAKLYNSAPPDIKAAISFATNKDNIDKKDPHAVVGAAMHTWPIPTPNKG